MDAINTTPAGEFFQITFDNTLDLGGICAPGDSGGGIKNSDKEIIGLNSYISPAKSNPLEWVTDITSDSMRKKIIAS